MATVDLIDNRAALRLNYELSCRVLEFVSERERVTAEDVRQEFFPGEMGTPYLYLDRLTAERLLLPVIGNDYPMSWIPAITPEEVAERQAALSDAARVRMQERWARIREKRERTRKPKSRISHAQCDHLITRTDRLACEKRR
ncbi:hypothetical protein [Streptomyces sp. NBC_01451]|uniref:hypothetical protein n=1 Tax=Streptomyces sp. NBC_01451 TaxID=2903872 RepID=UPI002E354CAA|nr:hypothetical protein [Streptomyces sp. NBC_01451]